METDIRCQRSIWKNRIEFVIFRGNQSGICELAQPLEFKPHDDYTPGKPTFDLTYKDAQCLMDELWNCGLRPSEGSGSAGSLAATEKHLKDMQSLAFGLLKKDGVPL